MMKEKIIFWPLLAVFIGTLVFGYTSKGKEKEAQDELLRDIEMATKKSRARVRKETKDKWNLDIITTLARLDEYKILLKRSPFFRMRHELEVKKVEAIPLKKEEPKEPLFKYKGRVMMGPKIVVIIEDQGTGKSFFVKEGDMIGDFLVLRIDEREVTLKKDDEEEIVLSAVKKEEEGSVK